MNNLSLRIPNTIENDFLNLIKNYLNQNDTIPVGASNAAYSSIHGITIAIKKIKELKGSIDRETGYFNRLSGKAKKLDKVSEILGGVMLKLARVGYAVSRDINEYKERSFDYFTDFYIQDKRDVEDFPKKSIEQIHSIYNDLIDFIEKTFKLLLSSIRVQGAASEDIEAISHELIQGIIIIGLF